MVACATDIRKRILRTLSTINTYQCYSEKNIFHRLPPRKSDPPNKEYLITVGACSFDMTITKTKAKALGDPASSYNFYVATSQ